MARDNQRPLVIVTGAYPPDVCGVGDYTSRLMAAAPPWWRLLVERRWTMIAAPSILRRLLRLHPGKVVVQYPTQGYGWSLVPHFLIFMGWLTRSYRPVLALHEFSSLSRKAQFALAIASHFAAHIIFTTEDERDRALRHRLFRSRVPTSIVGILSNIPWTTHLPRFRERAIDIAYFGHIRPNKGMEEFLHVAGGVRAAMPAVRVAIIGVIPAGYEAFGEMIAARCRDIGGEMIVGLDADAAASTLAKVRILYLPFQDGVSARRGSVLAGLGNGTIIASPVGPATPPALLPAIIACTGTMGDIDILRSAMKLSNEDAAALQQVGLDYIEHVLPRDWKEVVALYEHALAVGEADC